MVPQHAGAQVRLEARGTLHMRQVIVTIEDEDRSIQIEEDAPMVLGSKERNNKSLLDALERATKHAKRWIEEGE